METDWRAEISASSFSALRPPLPLKLPIVRLEFWIPIEFFRSFIVNPNCAVDAVDVAVDAVDGWLLAFACIDIPEHE